MTILTKSAGFEAVRNGATLVTGSQRLARTLHDEYDRQQLHSARAAWATADILPLSAWIKRAWFRLQERLWDAGTPPPLLLTGAQESAVWERVIAAQSPLSGLLDSVSLAGAARTSWSLLREWSPTLLPGEWEATPDTAAFYDWQQAYRSELSRNGWVDEASLPDLLLDAGPEHWRERNVLFAGFDEYTPRQRRLIHALERAGIRLAVVETATHPADTVLEACPDASGEIRAAAYWAAELLAAGAPEPIGVAVWDLRRRRRDVEHTFAEVLHSGDPASERAFNISLGLPLAEYPVVHTALLILNLLRGESSMQAISRLLRSPFVGGAEAEADRWALLDVQLRRVGSPRVTLDWLVLATRDACPQLHAALRRFRSKLPSLPLPSSTAEWARFFSSELAELGWPGDRARTSAEYQTLTRWTELLSEFAALDLVLGPVELTEALDRLQRLAVEDIYQPRTGEAPVQILGFFETTGLTFDHLRVIGLHDELWPQPVSPDPLLPLAAQKRHDMPGSSSARELAFAQRQIERLQTSAAHLVFSYPRREGDRDLRPSFLLADLPEREGAPVESSEWARAIARSAPELEVLDDSRAPEVREGAYRGGSYLLKDYAACPFRALALRRLRAEALDEPGIGVDASGRGSLVHKALERLWRELETSAALDDAGEVRKAIRAAVSGALDEQSRRPGMTPRFRALEQERLERALAAWIEGERQRPAFRVAALEQKVRVSVGGLELEARIDRIDELESGERILLDYKTGKVGSKAWDGERPDEPQLPLYAVTSEPPPAAVAFALLRAGKTCFQGIGAREGLLPKAKVQPEWEELIGEWRVVLETLARGFKSGDARVDPKRDACDYCEIAPLCRIQERNHGAPR